MKRNSRRLELELDDHVRIAAKLHEAQLALRDIYEELEPGKDKEVKKTLTKAWEWLHRFALHMNGVMERDYTYEILYPSVPGPDLNLLYLNLHDEKQEAMVRDAKMQQAERVVDSLDVIRHLKELEKGAQNETPTV